MYRIALLLILVCGFAGVAAGRVDHVSPNPPNRHFIDNVPFTSQLPNFCGPASLSSLLTYLGVTADQKEIACSAFTDPKSGTNGADLLLYCRSLGLASYSFNGTLERLKRLVSAGHPVLILQDRSRQREEGHFRVVVGYNDETETISLRDSNTPSLIALPYSEFEYLWKRRGHWALLTVQKDKDTFSDEFGKRNAVLHMDLAQAHMHKGEFEQAEAEGLMALQLQPGNPYAKNILSDIKSRRGAAGRKSG